MASWSENIDIIETAVYGKEMRPAIVDALRQSNGAIGAMTERINQLNARIDALTGGSGGDSGGGGGGIDIGDIEPPILVVNGVVTALETSANITA